MKLNIQVIDVINIGKQRSLSEYAKQLSEKIEIPSDTLTALIFIFVRACVHYALFEDEFYLKAQLGRIKQSIKLK